jgi:hypothetical protein
MSPSLASHDSHDHGHSNTCSPQQPQSPLPSCDAAVPMIITSQLDSATGAYSHDRLSSCREPFLCTAPQHPFGYASKPASPFSDYPRSLAPSRCDERTAHSLPASLGLTSANLVVPVPTNGGAGSPFDLSPSPSLRSNGRNYATTPDEHSSTYAAFVLTRSRAIKVSSLVV